MWMILSTSRILLLLDLDELNAHRTLSSSKEYRKSTRDMYNFSETRRRKFVKRLIPKLKKDKCLKVKDFRPEQIQEVINNFLNWPILVLVAKVTLSSCTGTQR